MHRAATLCVAPILAACFAACDSGRSGPSGQPTASGPVQVANPTEPHLPDDADGITALTVRALLAGDDAFERHAAALRTARSLNPSHAAARVFLAVADFLAAAKRNLTDANPTRGKLRELLRLSGFVLRSSTANFWELAFDAEDHKQGKVKDSAPSADVWHDFVRNEARPALAALVQGLSSTPPNFVYRVPAAAKGKLALLFNDALDVEIDVADVVLLRGAALAALGHIEAVAAYEHASLKPNDFDSVDYPNVDPVAVIETTYPTLGKLATGWSTSLSEARNRFTEAFDHYKLAAQLITTETKQQQDVGLVTVGARTFASATERTAFLTAEAAARAWAQSVVTASSSSQPLTITHTPKGMPIPANEQPTLRLDLPWAKGIQVRDIFLQTILNPITGRRDLGVASLAQLTPAMFTLDGIVVKWNGVAPGPGDLQDASNPTGLVYARAVDAPQHTKTVDGNAADWQVGVNAAHLAFTPVATLLAPHPDLGNILGAQDASELYFLIDKNLGAYVQGSSDSWSLRMAGSSGYASVFHTAFGTWTYGSAGPQFQPEVRTGAGGIEIRVPKANFPADQWLETEVGVFADNATYRIESERRSLFVRRR